jgi:ribonuclease P/MRP protein subunit RPP1
MKQLVYVQDKEIEKKLGIETELVSTKVVVEGGDVIVNRKAVENKKVDILLSPEKNDKRDFMFSRNSGLNQVLCKLAAKNNVAISFNFSDVLNCSGKERARLLGRMRQNVRLCKKYKVKMIFSSFAKNKYELRSSEFLKVFERVLNR